MLSAHITANRARSVVIETLLHEGSGLDASKIALIDHMDLKGKVLSVHTTDGQNHSVTLPKSVSPEELQEELGTLVKASDFERFKNAVATTMALKVDSATMNAALDSLASRLKGEPGEPGASVENVELQGDELVFTLTNGETFATEAPRGAPGEKGEEGDHIVDAELRPEPEGDKIVFTTAQGAEISMLAPAGPAGERGPEGPVGPAGPIGQPGRDGRDAPAPTLRIGEVATLPANSPATAEISGETPNYVLNLGIPAQVVVDDGEAHGAQDTGWWVARKSDFVAQEVIDESVANNFTIAYRRVGNVVIMQAEVWGPVGESISLSSFPTSFAEDSFIYDPARIGWREGETVIEVGDWGMILSGWAVDGDPAPKQVSRTWFSSRRFPEESELIGRRMS